MYLFGASALIAPVETCHTRGSAAARRGVCATADSASWSSDALYGRSMRSASQGRVAAGAPAAVRVREPLRPQCTSCGTQRPKRTRPPLSTPWLYACGGTSARGSIDGHDEDRCRSDRASVGSSCETDVCVYGCAACALRRPPVQPALAALPAQPARPEPGVQGDGVGAASCARAARAASACPDVPGVC